MKCNQLLSSSHAVIHLLCEILCWHTTLTEDELSVKYVELFFC